MCDERFDFHLLPELLIVNNRIKPIIIPNIVVVIKYLGFGAGDAITIIKCVTTSGEIVLKKFNREKSVIFRPKRNETNSHIPAQPQICEF